MDYRTIMESVKGIPIDQITVIDTIAPLVAVQTMPADHKQLSADILYIGKTSQLLDFAPSTLDGCSFLLAGSRDSMTGLPHANANLGLLPDNCSLQDILTDLKRILSDRNQIHESTSRLTNAMLEDKGLQHLAEVAADVLGMSVLITDNSYKHLAQARLSQDARDLIEWNAQDNYLADEFVREIQSRRIDEQIRSAGKPVLVNSSHGKQYLVMPVFIGNLEVAHVSLYSSQRKARAYEQELLGLFARMVANDIQKYSLVNASSPASHTGLLTDLFDGKTTSQIDTRKRLAVFGTVLKRFVRVMVVRPRVEQPTEFKLQMLFNQLGGNLPDGLPIIYKGSIVALVGAGTLPGEMQTLDGLRQFLEGFQLVAGISGPFSDLSETARYFKQASKAIEIGEMHQPANSLHDYDCLRIHHLSSLCIDSTQLSSIYHPAIAILRDHDARHQSALLDTLQTYIKCVRNPTQSAAALSIHRNTLFFRIDKIRKMTGIDFHDGDELMLLTLTFKLMAINRDR